MASTLLLDQQAWDLVLDAAGNIAVASEPYSLAQDAASAIKTFLGECYWDTLLGVPLRQDILGHNPAPALMKAAFVTAARTVEDVAAAQCFLSEVSARSVAGQVQVTGANGQSAAINFTVINPQGEG